MRDKIKILYSTKSILYQGFISSYIVLRIESRAFLIFQYFRECKQLQMYMLHSCKISIYLYEISELIDDRRT